MEGLTQTKAGLFPPSRNVFSVFANDVAFTTDNKLACLQLLQTSLSAHLIFAFNRLMVFSV